MSDNTTERPLLTFGVEIELLLKPKQGTALYADLQAPSSGFDPAVQPDPKVDKTKRAANRNAIRRSLAKALTKANIPATIGGDRDSWDTWYVKDEASLTEVMDARGGGYWAIELVSRILSTALLDWATELGVLFNVVRDNFDIQLTRGCSMHVHVRPNPKWDVAHLRKLIKAIGVFDDATMRIMPADRKMNPWARSNFKDGDKPTEKVPPEMRKAFDEVPTRTWSPYFALFDAQKMRAHLLIKWGGSRYVAWNFACLARCETVEFRRPPGVTTAADAQKWAAFAVAFACAATESDWLAPWVSSKRPATVPELQSFVARGLDLLDWRGFLNPRALVENTAPAMPLEYYDLEEVKRKRAKAERESGFEEKIIRSRQNSPASSHPSSPTARKTDSRPSSPASARSSSPAAPGARSNSPASRGGRPQSPAAHRPNLTKTRP